MGKVKRIVGQIGPAAILEKLLEPRRLRFQSAARLDDGRAVENAPAAAWNVHVITHTLLQTQRRPQRLLVETNTSQTPRCSAIRRLRVRSYHTATSARKRGAGLEPFCLFANASPGSPPRPKRSIRDKNLMVKLDAEDGPTPHAELMAQGMAEIKPATSGARETFVQCYELSGRPHAAVSAANMALKMGNAEIALNEYMALFSRFGRSKLPESIVTTSTSRWQKRRSSLTSNGPSLCRRRSRHRRLRGDAVTTIDAQG